LVNTGINDTAFHTGLKIIQQRILHTYGKGGPIAYGADEQNLFIVEVSITDPQILKSGCNRKQQKMGL